MHPYIMTGQTLQNYSYLGVQFTSELSWGTHINTKFRKKQNSSLGFPKSGKVANLLNSLHHEYACPAWDTNQQTISIDWKWYSAQVAWCIKLTRCICALADIDVNLNVYLTQIVHLSKHENSNHSHIHRILASHHNIALTSTCLLGYHMIQTL